VRARHGWEAGKPSGMKHVDEHLESLVALYESHKGAIDAEADDGARVNALVRRNVEAQIERLAALDLINDAEQPPTLLGLVYAIDRGMLETVCERRPGQAMQSRAA